jgi:hypothetical protein
MGKMVLTNVRAFAGAVDLTGVSNKAEITPTIATVDVTNYGGVGWRELLGGLAETDIMVGGFEESGAVAPAGTFEDPELFAQLGAVGPWSFCPAGAADGALAYLTSALEASYKPIQGSVGDAAGFEASGKGTSKLARGVVAHPPGTARTATGTGTAFQIGALTASQALYVNLHVLSVAGTTPSLTARVESDNAAGFPSPVTVGTFSAAATVGGQTMRIAGPVTDDWFRVAWTISGTTPSFLFLVTLGRA